MSTLFTLRMVHGLSLGPRRVAAGCTLEVDAQTAARLLRSGDAVLINDGDLARLAQALGAGRWSAPATR